MKKTAEEILDENVSFRDEVKKEFVLRAMEEYVSQFKQKWIKIESEKDLPKDGVLCWFNDKEGGVVDGGVAFDNKQFILENATHYMPIIKPEPPKED